MSEAVQAVVASTAVPPRVLSDRVSAIAYPVASFGLLLPVARDAQDGAVHHP